MGGFSGILFESALLTLDKLADQYLSDMKLDGQRETIQMDELGFCRTFFNDASSAQKHKEGKTVKKASLAFSNLFIWLDRLLFHKNTPTSQ